MKNTIFGSKFFKIIIAALLLIITWGLFIYVADWPMTQRDYYACPICRANKNIDTIFMVPVSIKVNDNEFSRYYRSHADPQHRHSWLGCGVSRETRTGGISAHGTPRPLRLKYEVALAILQSLPDAKSRKRFFEQLYNASEFPPGHPTKQKNIKAIWKLNDAYWENEHRQDWLIQLQKVGLYP